MIWLVMILVCVSSDDGMLTCKQYPSEEIQTFQDQAACEHYKDILAPLAKGLDKNGERTFVWCEEQGMP